MGHEERDPREGKTRLTEEERRQEEKRRRELAEEGPLKEAEDEERPDAARPAAGEAPLRHLVTGRFGDTTPDPRDPGEGSEPE